MNSDLLLTKLAALPDCRVTTEPETSQFLPADWPAPIALVEPVETSMITEIVRISEPAGAAIVPMGGGTKRFVGYPPRSDKPYLLLRLQGCSRIIAYEPDDLTVTCEPGVTLSALQATLAAKNQSLALDVPHPERATLGGIVSANAAGFQRGAYGAARDLALGVRAVIAGGIEVRGGGRVVKNVAGYDVCKLFTGAWGTLGIVTEITLKVRSQVPDRQVFAWEMPDCARAAEIGLALHHAQLAPLFLLASNENETETRGKPRLIVGMEGARERVEWQAKEFARRIAAAGVSSQATRLEATELNALRNWQARDDAATVLAARFSCLLTDLPATIVKLEALDMAVTADCVIGTISCASRQTKDGLAAQIIQAAPPESALIWTRSNADITERWGASRPDAVLHKALKSALDPQNVFSPGRFVSRL